jgi:predicted outer membrane repeat protein
MFGLFRKAFVSRRPEVETLEDRCVPATFTVTNTSDANPGSLRAAVLAANARAGADIIQFAPQFNGTITLLTGEIDITDDVTINGLGANRCIVSGNKLGRIFDLGDALTPITVSINGLKLTQGRANVAGENDGGALYAGGSNVTVKNCVISGNRALDDGGAVSSSGTFTAINTIFSNNGATDEGGAFYSNGGLLSFTNCKFLNNSAGGYGGGLYLSGAQGTFTGCTISMNKAVNGGGGLYMGGSTVTITNTTISQNTASFGGGIASFGGGRLNISNSTISGNRANGDPVNVGSNVGGAGALLYNVETVMVQCTISSNVDQTGFIAAGVPHGGGGLNLYGGNTVIRNSTIAFNSSNGQGGGLFVHDSAAGTARLLLVSTIVSNNIPAVGNRDVFAPVGEGDISAIQSLIRNIQPGFINGTNIGNQVGVNPRLLALANNGGPTQTHLLAASSPAINAGANPDELQTDQRGPDFPRIRGGIIDIGAVEVA